MLPNLPGVVRYGAQQAARADSGSVSIRTETRVVLVDAVVTDKKGGYVTDLTRRTSRFSKTTRSRTSEFHFRSRSGLALQWAAALPGAVLRQLTVDFADQARARRRAKFIDANAGPNRMMAMVNYRRSHADRPESSPPMPTRLKAVVDRDPILHRSTLPTAVRRLAVVELRLSGAQRRQLRGGVGIRDVILALRSIAKELSASCRAARP